MTSRPYWIMAFWLLLAVVLLAGAGMLQGRLDSARESLELVDAGDAVGKNHPEVTLLNAMPGGLRAPIVSYQWIRSQQLVQDGRYYDARDRAEWICALQPRFPAVWDFHAFNMSWNIAAMGRTPDERYNWVNNGIALLRDRGIPLNPKSLMLYKQLAWTYFSKIGTDLDEYNQYYKQRLAAEFQHLLGSPPFAPTDTVIAAFRPIAQAPLDISRKPDPDRPIQADKLKELLQDADVAAYTATLGRYGIAIDQGLLDKWNRFSMDDAAAIVRAVPPVIDTAEDKAISDLINDPSTAALRGRMLAFVRAQLLWNRHHLDPKWMLHVMEKYHAPLDWRSAQAHALYWQTYGNNVCQSDERGDIDAVNSDRMIQFSLKDLTWFGRMTYIENPNNPDYPRIARCSDIRYIKPAHEETIRYAKAVSTAQDVEFDQNAFVAGHRYYLTTCIQMLFAANRFAEAQELLDWIRSEYHMTGGIWDIKLLEDFVVATINNDGRPVPATAITQITGSMETAYVSAAAGDVAKFRTSFEHAARIYGIFSKDAVERLRFPPLQEIAGNLLLNILIDPRVVGYNMTLAERSNMYSVLLDAWPTMLAAIYDRISPQLRRQCELANVNFEKAFPVPPGLAEFRQFERSRLTPTTQIAH